MGPTFLPIRETKHLSLSEGRPESRLEGHRFKTLPTVLPLHPRYSETSDPLPELVYRTPDNRLRLNPLADPSFQLECILRVQS